MTHELEQLPTAARLLPTATAEEREQQTLSFAYENLALHRKPTRKAFRSVAIDELGWSEEKFEAWAKDLQWREDQV